MDITIHDVNNRLLFLGVSVVLFRTHDPSIFATPWQRQISGTLRTIGHTKSFHQHFVLNNGHPLTVLTTRGQQGRQRGERGGGGQLLVAREKDSQTSAVVFLVRCIARNTQNRGRSKHEWKHRVIHDISSRLAACLAHYVDDNCRQSEQS